ncbi:MAG TPA: GntR family transcriptional regulator [Candidatus Binatia bacterium]|nr:GntR family transcriptional regulator [Candidatus Binatia bacterium]
MASSRADHVYGQLRAAILGGELRPGERLVEETVATQHRVSRTPVREALHRLEVDGLVRTANRGVAVVDLDGDELADLCVAREGMEGLAARLAATSRTELDLAALGHVVDETRGATASGDVARLVELNHAFHEGVWRAARNRYLAGELRLLRSLIEGRQDTTLRSPARQVESLAEHAELLQLLRCGDEAAAEALTRRHFQAAMALRLTDV